MIMIINTHKKAVFERQISTVQNIINLSKIRDDVQQKFKTSRPSIITEADKPALRKIVKTKYQ